MTRTATIQKSFAGGEISPLMQGRLDLGPYQTGLALCENFIATAQGPARFRPGTRFLQYGKSNDARLVPFVYSDDQAYFVEFAAGDNSGGVLRIHTVDGTLLDTSAPAPVISSITQANPAVMTLATDAFADGDDAYLDTVGMDELSGRWYRLRRTGSGVYELTTPAGGDVDSRGYTAFASGTAAAPIEISHPYAPDELVALRYAQSADILTITCRAKPVYTLRRTGPNVWQFVKEVFGPTIAAPTSAPTATGHPTGGSNARNEYYAYTITSIDSSSVGVGESFASPASTAVSIDLTTAGAYVDVSVGSPAPTGYRYNFYKQLNGLWGYIGQSEQSLEDRNIVPDMSIAPPSFGDNEFDAPGDYPTAVSYYQQRKAFAGSINDPQTVWMTRNGTETDTTYTVPARDDNSLAFGIASREMQAIQHMVPLRQLLVFTSSAVWKVVPQNNEVLTPSSIAAELVAYAGAAPPQPVAVEASVLYAFSRGGRVGEVRYAESADDFAVNDACLFASHLFDGYAIRDMAMMETPIRVLWCARSDGRLVALTYQPEHEVLAWHRHDLGGEVRSMCMLPTVENRALAEDVMALFVRRKNDNGDYTTLELLHGVGDYSSEWRADYWTPEINLAERYAVHADCAMVYEGAPASTLYGLHHLEGMQVVVVADGAVLPPLTVRQGVLNITDPAGLIVVGLPYRGRLTTLPLVFENVPAAGQGTVRTPTRAHLRVFHSTGIFVGPDFDTMDEMKVRTDEPYGVAPRWRTGQYEATVAPNWSFEGAVCVEQRDPVPASVVSIAFDVEIGG